MPFDPSPHLKELQQLQNEIKKLPTAVGIEAVKFFKEGFNLQGWQGDNGLDPWKARKEFIQGRNILIGSGSANLKRGISKQVQRNQVRIYVDGPAREYADIHNFGGTIRVPVTSRMKRWAWAMYYREMKGGSPTMASMYKAMALTRKTYLTIEVPKRQFIGTSKQLERRLKEVIRKRLKM